MLSVITFHELPYPWKYLHFVRNDKFKPLFEVIVKEAEEGSPPVIYALMHTRTYENDLFHPYFHEQLVLKLIRYCGRPIDF
jgi:hypothetical protein